MAIHKQNIFSSTFIYWFISPVSKCYFFLVVRHKERGNETLKRKAFKIIFKNMEKFHEKTLPRFSDQV